MFTKAAITSVILAASVATISMIPADMSKLEMPNYQFTIPDHFFPSHHRHTLRLVSAQKENGNEQAILLLFFLGGSARGAQVASLGNADNDIRGDEDTLISSNIEREVEVAGWLKRLAWIII